MVGSGRATAPTIFRHGDIRHADVVELRDLRALLAVVHTGSFTAAAAQLGYTQSAVSQQIAALEHELGHRLLERRPVRPTAAGARLAEHAARILLRVDAARSELAHLDPSLSELRVGACPLAAPGLLAVALRELRIAHAGLRVTVRSVDEPTAVEQVASGVDDLALVDGISAPDNPLALADPGLIQSTALVEVPLVVALPVDHPLGRRDGLDLDTMADAPWIATSALPGVPGRQLPPDAAGCDGGGMAYEGNDVSTLLGLIAAGHGAALLPAPACNGSPGVAAVPLRHPVLVHRTEVLSLRTPHAGRRRVIDALRARASASAAGPG
jgi:DNA-binding transcriptional LysR family regulator